MVKYIFYVLPLLAGMAVALQSIVNSQLGTTISSPLLAVLVSFVVGTTFIVGLVLITRQSVPQIDVWKSLNWYHYIGGFLGVFMVLTAILCVPKIGVANMVSLIVASQLITAVVFDHIGFLGTRVQSVDIYRVIGVIMLIGGAYLVNKK